MAYDILFLTKPESGSVNTYKIPVDGASKLNFAPEDIESLSLSDTGALVMEFADGATIIIENFQDLAAQDFAMMFNNGMVIDPTLLTSVGQSPLALFGNSSPVIAQPKENSVNEITLTEGKNYICDFDPDQIAHVEMVDGKMILNFPDGSQIVLANYEGSMNGDLPPELTMKDGTVIDSSELLTELTSIDDLIEEISAAIEPASGKEEELTDEQLTALAEDMADVEPTSGEGNTRASNSGYGFNSTAADVPFDSPNAIGPLDPTQLRYSAPTFNNENFILVDDIPVFSSEIVTIDETAGSLSKIDGFPGIEGKVTVNFGADGAGSIKANGTYNFGGTVPNSSLTSNGEPVIITSTQNGYTGTADGEIVFTMTINPNGTYRFIQTGSLDHPDQTSNNEIIRINFGITATDADGDSALSNITVNIKDDAPVVLSQTPISVDESDFTNIGVVAIGQFNVDGGFDNLPPDAFSSNGNYRIINGNGDILTSGGLIVTILKTDTGYEGKLPNGNLVFTLNIDPATGEYGFQQILSVDHPDNTNPNDFLVLQFGIDVKDYDGDTKSGEISIGIFDDEPRGVNDFSSAEEDQVISGNIFQNDFLSTDANHTVVSLSYNGQIYTLNKPFQTEFGTFTMEPNGIWTFQVTAEDPDGREILTYTIVDADGDRSISTLEIRVTPDGEPLIVTGDHIVDETSLATGLVTITGNLEHDAGQDGFGTVRANGNFNATGSLTELKHNDVPIVVTMVDNVYFGKANNITVFELHLRNDGTYVFTLHETLDHKGTEDPNDVINLNFEFGVTLIDTDGDTVDGTLTIHVHDDAPVAYDDAQVVIEGNHIVQGNILENDHMSQDGRTSVVEVRFGNQIYKLPEAGDLDINGTYGLLTIDSNGRYTYKPGLNSSDGVDTFTYVIRDSDGDRDTAEFSFLVKDDVPIIIDETNQVDETSGFDTVTGTVNINYGADAPGSVMGTDNFSSSYTLTSNGAPVIVSYDEATNTYTGAAGATGSATSILVFTMVINANGTYHFRQHGPIDHGNSDDPNDSIDLVFGIKATDSDGDIDNGKITIKVLDDGPRATNDTISMFDSQSQATGNVLTNDSFGQDANGVLLTTGTLTGNFGTLLLNANGSFVYTNTQPNLNILRTDTFEYTIRDSDGDETTAVLTINFQPDPPPPPPPPTIRDNGDGGDGGDGGGSTPLVLDLDGDGIEVTHLKDGVMFDVGADGDLDKFSWVEADDGFLVRDLNDDGKINDHSEMYGRLDTDGFNVLKREDSNNDGLIDNKDENFNNLEVWQDLNQDGITQDGELKTLQELGIKSISLGATMTDHYIEGNWVAYESTFTREDGTTGTVADVWLTYIDAKTLQEVYDTLGEEAANHWLENIYAEAKTFIPETANDSWKEGDPVVLGTTQKIKEHDLNKGIAVNQGEITVFSKEAYSVSANNDFRFGGSLENGQLTSHGIAVTVSLNEQTGIYTGTADGQVVFDLHVMQDGSYRFNLYDTLDHANDVNLDDNILLHFGVTVTDELGNTTDSAIRIKVRDTGSLTDSDIAHGQDQDDIGQTGNFAAVINDTPTPLTHDGLDIHVTFDADTGIYQGATVDDVIFNARLNDAGGVDFNLFGTVDQLVDGGVLKFGSESGFVDVTVTSADIAALSHSGDALLMGAIEESILTVAAMSEGGDGATDLSLLIDQGDAVTETIQDFVHQTDYQEAVPVGSVGITAQNDNVLDQNSFFDAPVDVLPGLGGEVSETL